MILFSKLSLMCFLYLVYSIIFLFSPGNEPNLVAYWRFDEPSGTNIVDSSPSGFDGFLSGMDANSIYRMKQTTAASGPFSQPPRLFIPLAIASRQTQYNTPISISCAVDADIGAQTYSTNVRTFPAHSLLCFGPGSCNANSPASGPGPASREFIVTMNPRRGSCGRTESGIVYVTEGSETTNDFRFTVTIPPLAGN